ncbi:radical SAM protein [Tropicimonas sp. TH_r6]|uniref:radical SAM protein n=1 Tax=Tropicimonas sp. TH_r6 TaxID=3082085 RepID=UPI002953215F|nr:radical SAM protein [Tropicimonas sp. TH_r6]MDV7145856.1 radical SAM protein [Tropicimonas sp. TH_r6]
MSYEGKIYRPWMEADSELIQVTLGCSVNTCTFCSMFRDKSFRRKPLEEIFSDIEILRRYRGRVESIFLIDGNVMVLKTEFLLKVIARIRETFPELKNLAMYSGLNDLRRKSVEELKQLRAAGVTTVYAGLESGDAGILADIRKGMTQGQAIEGMELAKAAGIRVLLSVIFGLGGRDRSREHIEETTRLLNILKPEELAPMALAIQPGTELEQQVEDGTFVMPTPLQVLEEEKYLLENLGNFEHFYWGDHGNNIAHMRGWMPKYRDKFLEHVEMQIAENPVAKQDELVTHAW